MWQTIEVTEHDDGIVEIALDRPESHNAKNFQLIEELDEATQEYDAKDDTRVILISGNGPSFSTGHDLAGEDLEYLRDEGVIPDIPNGNVTKFNAEPQVFHEEEMYSEPIMALKDLSVPTVAKIDGYCGGAGLMLLAACDLAVATEDATFQNPVMRFCGCGVELLLEPWEMGFRKGKEFLWTGDTITGTEAEELGMVNHAVSPESIDERTMTLATKLARMPSFALQMSKKSFNYMEEQMGLRDAWKYHFMVHQIVHLSNEWQEWHEEMNEVLVKEGFAAWVQERDAPFDM
jgi:enoyl-CoA hydratase